MFLKTEIEELLNAAQKEQQIFNKELKHLPAGCLQVWKQGEYTRFVQCYRKKSVMVRHGIGKKEDMVRKLARKAYLKSYLQRQGQNIELLKKLSAGLLPTDMSDVFAEMPKYYRMLPEEYFFSPVEPNMHPSFSADVPIRDARLWLEGLTSEEWGRMPYRANSLYMEERRVVMPNGLLVRSKSEASILQRFSFYGIPHHYDEMVKMGGQLVSPDVIGARRDGKIIYLEHFGKMDDSSYRARVAGFWAELMHYLQSATVKWVVYC